MIVKDKFGRHIWIRIEYGLRDCCGYICVIGRGNGKLDMIRHFAKEMLKVKNDTSMCKS